MFGRVIRSALVLGVFVGFSGGVEAATTFFTETFEEPDISQSWYVFQTVGDSGSWNTLSGAGIEIQRNTVVTAHSGDQYVELDSHNGKGGLTTGPTDTRMAHVFSQLGAGHYEVSFFYQPRTERTDDNAIMAGVYGWNGTDTTSALTEVTVGYVGLADAGYAYTETRPAWQQFTFDFKLTEKTDVALTFESLQGSHKTYGGFVDTVSVSVAPIPEPSTWAMLLAGFGLAGAALRRRGTGLGWA